MAPSRPRNSHGVFAVAPAAHLLRTVAAREKPEPEAEVELRRHRNSSISTPLLLAGVKQRWKRFEASSKHATDEGLVQEPSPEYYQMYLISVLDLLDLPRFLPHQELLRQNKLREWSPELAERTIFVSHQWLAWQQPDPENKQFSALQRLFRRVLDRAHVNVKPPSVAGASEKAHVTARELQAALPHMFVWLDYLSMPQLEDRRTSVEALESSDGRSLCHMLDAAVRSIPSYIERSTCGKQL